MPSESPFRPALLRPGAALVLLLVLAGASSYAQSTSINGHTVVLDGQQKIVTWMTPAATAFDRVPRPAVELHQDRRADVPGTGASLVVPAILLLRRLPARHGADPARHVDERRGREDPQLVRVRASVLRLHGRRLRDADRHRAGRLRARPRHQPLDLRLALLPLHHHQRRRHRVPRLHLRRPLRPSRDPGRPRRRHGAHLLPHVPLHGGCQVPHRRADTWPTCWRARRERGPRRNRSGRIAS